MRINEIILETTQVDEISMRGVGQGISNTAGKVVTGVKDFWSGMKQGWEDSTNKDNTTPDEDPAVTPNATPSPGTGMNPVAKPAPGVNPNATPSPETGMNPASAPAALVTVRQINKAIPTMRTRDLTSVKKKVDATLASKQPAVQQATNLRSVAGGRAPVAEFQSKFLGMMI